MRKLRYWYKAIPPQLSRKDLVYNGDADVWVVKNNRVVGIVTADEAKRLTSWRLEPVVWEKKHGE